MDRGVVWIIKVFRFCLYKILAKPGPNVLIAIYLNLRWRCRVCLKTNIRFPFNLKIGKRTVIGKCKMICREKVSIGEDVYIHDGVILETLGGCISIGNRTHINPYCILYGAGGLEIGNDVGVAAHSIFIPANHGIEDLNIPLMNQSIKKKGIKVADNVWIGANCVILDGVKIETGAVVAAGAVVNRSISANDVVGGVPAKVIKNRGKICIL